MMAGETMWELARRHAGKNALENSRSAN